MQDGEIIDYSHKDHHKWVFGSGSTAYADNYDRIFGKKAKHGKVKLDKRRNQTPRRVQRSGKKGTP